MKVRMSPLLRKILADPHAREQLAKILADEPLEVPLGQVCESKPKALTMNGKTYAVSFGQPECVKEGR